MKKRTLGISILLAIVLVIFCLWFFFLIKPWTSFAYYPKDLVSVSASEKSFPINNIPLNLKQSGYYCGSYSMYFVSQLLQNNVSLEAIIENNKKYEIPRTGVVPEVLVSSFENIGINAKAFTFRNYSPEEKGNALRSLLQTNPVILLVMRHGYLHFITLVGYENDTVYLYDSMLPRENKIYTIDNTNEWAGNDMMSFDELIEIWEDVSVFSLYKSMAIILPTS